MKDSCTICLTEATKATSESEPNFDRFGGFSPEGRKTVDIYVYMQGQRRGPYERAQLEEMWNRGQIPADTLCWYEGMPQWGLISDLFGNTKMATPLSTDASHADSMTFPAAS